MGVIFENVEGHLWCFTVTDVKNGKSQVHSDTKRM
jgi:hypothetical protein